MTERTLTALFDDRSDAQTAIEQLVGAGIPRDGIRLTPETETGTAATRSRDTSYDTSRDNKGFWSSLGDMFMPNEDRYSYAEALDRGSTMVSVTVDEDNAVLAQNILEEHGTVNLDEREASWREEGWTGYRGDSDRRMAATSDASHGEEAIPIVEEQVKIGKREVGGGRVRVRSYVVETPVDEQVTLRDETVDVETRAVDRDLTDDEAQRLFQDRTIEAEEVDEEAIVSKTARVTGEVVVKKGVTERTENVRDTVRRTQVDVEDERNDARIKERKRSR